LPIEKLGAEPAGLTPNVEVVPKAENMPPDAGAALVLANPKDGAEALVLPPGAPGSFNERAGAPEPNTPEAALEPNPPNEGAAADAPNPPNAGAEAPAAPKAVAELLAPLLEPPKLPNPPEDPPNEGAIPNEGAAAEPPNDPNEAAGADALLEPNPLKEAAPAEAPNPEDEAPAVAPNPKEDIVFGAAAPNPNDGADVPKLISQNNSQGHLTR
jgi:hypothetical protein